MQLHRVHLVIRKGKCPISKRWVDQVHFTPGGVLVFTYKVAQLSAEYLSCDEEGNTADIEEVGRLCRLPA
jgi:hypothetical protein